MVAPPVAKIAPVTPVATVARSGRRRATPRPVAAPPLPEERMRIVDLTPEHCPLYFVCLEDYSAEMKEAGDHKARWYETMRTRGLRVKLAEDDDGRIAGMIQYLPIEHSPAEGEDLYFVLCIWVHAYKKLGPGDRRRRGLGTALLAAAEADARALGARGLAAWGLGIPIWMRAGWFKRHGYRVADRDGLRQLVWKPFDAAAAPPRWMRPRQHPEPGTDRARVTAFVNGWCPGQNITAERARRAAGELGEGVSFEAIDTTDPAARSAWGFTDAVFIDGKLLRSGPPPAYDRVKRRMERALRRK